MLNHKTYGTGPHLVILHGLFGMLDNWSTLARRWAEHYTVTLVDLRNHGRSFHAEEMTYDLMAEDIATFLEEQGIDECCSFPSPEYNSSCSRTWPETRRAVSGGG